MKRKRSDGAGVVGNGKVGGGNHGMKRKRSDGAGVVGDGKVGRGGDSVLQENG